MNYLENFKKYPHGHELNIEAMKANEKFYMTYVIDGVVRWRENNQIPEIEYLELWHFFKKPFSFNKTIEMYNRENRGHIYNNKPYDYYEDECDKSNKFFNKFI